MGIISQVINSARSVYQAVSDGVKMVEDMVTPKQPSVATFDKFFKESQKLPQKLNCECSTSPLLLDRKYISKLQNELSRLLIENQRPAQKK